MSLCVLPDFAGVELDKVAPQLDALLDEARAEIKRLETAELSELLSSLEEIDDCIDKYWSVISHLNGVMNSPELREVYAQCQPKLMAYGNEVGQNRALFERAEALAASDIELTAEQRTGLEHLLRDFRLAGVALEGEAKERFKAIRLRLSELSTDFQNRLLDATQGWFKHVTNVAELAGVPDSALEGYAEAAKAKELAGYCISLDVPAYLPVMQYAENRELRREMYEAYSTRASDQGPTAGEWDNSEVMVEILQLRAELAGLLGYNNYAEVSLAPKMADSPQQVIEFLRELAAKSQPRAKAEFAELQAFAAEKGCNDLQAWDVPYYSEQLRTERYAISQEELKPYFPVDVVQEGLFKVTGELFGITFERDTAAALWHDDARCYRLLRDGKQVATVYTDLFARANKRGGAWMADFCGRRKIQGETQLPVAFVTCNFTPPTSKRPSLLTHNDVTTLFHEFGHALHHMLTEVDVLAVSGINGVAWDAVELPSQLLENWCWQPSVVPMISGHYETGEPLPEDMLQKLLAAKNFQSGLQMMRQLEFALFDMLLHAEAAPASAADIQSLLNRVRDEVAVYPVPTINRFQHGFAHIFAGGYAAGYYSYKWAELLSADVFSRFAEEGVMNRELGQEFVDKLLSRGGSDDPMKLFRDFRGRDPQLEPLLRDAGILEDAA
ncbi:oligopeptidase A [Litorivivens lipolytica]|uniref:oligopeptidase A n=1 Tax=Litorivivens lipolytica TaxID=1524264 RepID=A0A7W4W827_9GAMM|nr:M3 family metallopeptidase [Litorivivens lipolytica]MBB3048614.1 oligopeptidase A [Litorivivens lipolytica]